MKTIFGVWLGIGLLVLAPAALSRNQKTPEAEALPPGAIYRYTNPQGSMVMTHTLPEEGLYAGYDIVDAQGRVIRTVEPAPTPEQQAAMRAQREQALDAERQSQRDRELLRMYAAPDDAERARDRQIAALQLNIDYARGNISQTRSRLDQEISNAARIERSGREVPENTSVLIDRYTRQISDLEAEIAQHEADIEQVRQNFEPIIERLRLITSD